MLNKIRWGIPGTGNIAGQFARSLSVLPEAEVVAVVYIATPHARRQTGGEYYESKVMDINMRLRKRAAACAPARRKAR